MNRVAGKASQTIAIIEVIGMARIAPGSPQIAVQKDRATMMTKGLRAVPERS